MDAIREELEFAGRALDNARALRHESWFDAALTYLDDALNHVDGPAQNTSGATGVWLRNMIGHARRHSLDARDKGDARALSRAIALAERVYEEMPGREI